MKTITLEDLRVPATATEGWYHIEPAGDHENVVTMNGEEKTIKFSINPQTIKTLVEAGVPKGGLMVDKDHLSHSEGVTTEAMGWVKDLAGFEDEDGVLQLAGFIKWSSIGHPLVEGEVYKRFSTEYEVTPEEFKSGVLHPKRLSGLALTNRENNQGQRGIGNSASVKRDLILRNSAPTPKPQKNTIMNPEVAAALGLPAEATVEEILAAIKALQSSEEAALESEIEGLLNSEGLEGLEEEEKEAITNTYKMDRKAGRVLMNALKAKKAEKVAVGNTTPKYGKGGLPPATPGHRSPAATMKNNSSSAVVAEANVIMVNSQGKIKYWKAVNMAKAKLGIR